MPARPQLSAVDTAAADTTPAGPVPVPLNAGGLAIPRLRVVPADGDPFVVQALNPDLMLFEDTAAKHRWPSPGTAPFRWLTFLAWAAARRTKVIPADLTWEVFAATTLEVSNLTAEGGAAELATPTPPAVGTD